MVRGATGNVEARRRLGDCRRRHAGAIFVVGATAVAVQLTCGQTAMAQQTTNSTNGEGARDAEAASSQKPTSAKQSASRNGTASLATVVVSARKKLERAQDVPVSVSSLNAQSLIDQNKTSLQDFFSEVPGVNLAASDRGTSQVSLRGITTGGTANPTTGITVDDSPFGASLQSIGGGANIPDFDPSDLARIEVLRGPQGTLYGASSLGGLIRYVTVPANPYNFQARVELDGSSTEHGGLGFGARAAVNVPIVKDKLAVRVSAYDTATPGFIDDVRQGTSNVDSVHSRGARIAALWNVTDTLSIRSSAMYQQSWSDGSSTVDTNRVGVPLYGEYAHARIPGTDGFERTIGFYDFVVAEDLGWAKLSSTTSYSRVNYSSMQDATSTLAGFLHAVAPNANLGAAVDTTTHVNKLTQEFRIDSPDGNHKIDWRLGVFYTHEEGNAFQGIDAVNPVTAAVISGFPTVAAALNDATYRELAGFGSLTYHFTSQFDVQVGGRYSENWQDATQNSNGLLVGGTRSSNGASRQHSATYSITPRFKFSNQLMVYGTISTGYRPGGPNNIVSATTPTTYQPDRTTNYELGLKGDLFNNTLSFATDVYYIDWKNIQLLETDANGLSFFSNGGAAVSKGVETSITWVPARDLTLTGNVVYGSAKLTEDLPASSVDVGHSGDRLPFSSRWAASINGRQEFPLDIGGVALRGFVGGTITFVGQRNGQFQTAGVERLNLPAYTTYDLFSGVHMKRWSLNLFAKNIFNKYGYVGGTVAGQTNRFVVLQPRTIGLTLAYQM